MVSGTCEGAQKNAEGDQNDQRWNREKKAGEQLSSLTRA